MNEQATKPVPSVHEAGLPTIFGRLRDEIDHLFDDFSLPGSSRSIFRLPNGEGFSPAIELKDCEDHYVVAVELPGLDEKDIDVELADGVLSISGEKRSEFEEETANCLVSERSYGSFQRRFTLPSDIDPDGIKATYEQGVLRLDIKKDAKAMGRARKIAVG